MHLGGPQGPNYFCGIFSIFFRDRTCTWEVPRAPIIFVEFLVFFFGAVRAPGRPRGRRKSRTGAPAEIYNLSEFLQRKPTLPTSKSDST